MLRVRLALLLLAASVVAAHLAVAERPAPAEQSHPRAQGIAFLHLKLGPQVAELAGFQVTPGRLKPPVQRAGERIVLRVLSAAGELLWEGAVDDPRTQVIESSGIDGRTTRKVVERNAPELMARVPFFEEGQVVRVSRATPAAAATAHEKRLGTFRLTR